MNYTDENPANQQDKKKQIGNPRHNNDQRNSTNLKKKTENQEILQTTGERITKVFGGCNALPGGIPWQVVLEDMYCATLCGGTQINLKFILTAAHCIDQFKKKPSELCPTKKIEKKSLPYPNNILSKHVLYFCCYTSKKNTF